MARIAFFGKSSNTPRTRFHTNRDPQLTQKLSGDVAQLDNKIDTIQNKVEKLDVLPNLDNKIDNLSKNIGAIAQYTSTLLLGLLPVHIPPPNELSEKVYLCLRAINRIEGYVLDKDFKIEKSNKNLNKMAADELTKNALECLKVDGELQGEFNKIYNPFNTEEIPERTERLWNCQQLRQKIIHYFSAQQPMVLD